MIDENAARVRVEAVVEYAEVEVCTDDLVLEMHTVRLAGPVGKRDLVGCDPDDGAADCTAGSSGTCEAFGSGWGARRPRPPCASRRRRRR